MKTLLTMATMTAWMAASAFAQESLPLDAAIGSALKNNRELTAARVRIQEAEARLQQAGLWPNPELELDGRFDTFFNNEGQYNFAATLNQPFSVSGRIGSQKGVARVDILRTVAEVADMERRVVGEVRRAFTELFAVEEQLKLQRFLIGLNQELLTATRTALAGGQVSEKDMNAIEIALQQARQREKVLETQRRARVIEVNKLTGQPPAHDFVAVGELKFRVLDDESAFTEENALMRRPDFLQARLDVNLAQAEQRLAKAERFEDWKIGAGYEREQSVVDGAPPQAVDQFVGLKLSVPLPLFDRKQGRIRETVARADRADKSVEALKLEIEQELADALNRVRTLAPLLESYQTGILKKAEDNVKLVENGYRQGQISIVEVIQTRQQFAELKSTYIDTLRDYELSRIDLEIASGMFPSAIQSSRPTDRVRSPAFRRNSGEDQSPEPTKVGTTNEPIEGKKP